MTHAPLSPSSAARWLKCIGSAYLTHIYNIESKSSPAADEGTRLHEQVYMHLTGDNVDLDDLSQEAINQLDSLGLDHKYMEFEASCDSMDFVEIYGTADIIYNDHKTTRLIIDFKFGGVPVDVNKNLQLMTYLAADYRLDRLMDMQIIIIQPKVFSTPQVYSVSCDEYNAHFHNLKLADRLFCKLICVPNGYIDAKMICNSGSHCNWCPAKHKCPIQIRKMFDVKEVVDVNSLTIDNKLDILKHKKHIIEILNAIEDEMRTHLKFNFYENVRLKKGACKRSWTNEKLAKEFLSSKFDKDKIIIKQLISPAELSKLASNDVDIDSFIKDNVTVKRNKETIIFDDK